MAKKLDEVTLMIVDLQAHDVERVMLALATSVEGRVVLVNGVDHPYVGIIHNADLYRVADELEAHGIVASNLN
jgi:hypothetical protein